jgi:hypothetical protein
MRHAIGSRGLVGLVLSALLLSAPPGSAQGRVAASLAQDTAAVNPPAVRTYPAADATIQEWIDALNSNAIRAHSWDTWQSITSDTGKPGTPVWETWYSGQEVFPPPNAARTSPGTAVRPTFHVFERQHQVKHSGVQRDIPVDQAEQVLAFNRYSPSLANAIWNKDYNSAATLNALNQQFDRERTPVSQRSISTSDARVDASQIVLKPVFEFISGTAPTAIPYWAGVSPQTATDLDNPTPNTWRQCVVVDPTGVHRPGSRLAMPCNQEPSAERDVISLDNFYAIQISADEAKNFSSFAANSGDDLGANAQSDPTSILNMVKAGNIAVLVAMHVTTKEIPNWTWQTFWWGQDPSDVLFGRDRPPSIPAPWSHYNLNTAYYMTAPSNSPRGDPLVTFNPYLETNLSGCVPNSQASPCSPSPPQTAWTGVHTNCMTCHRMAAWGGPGINPPYWPNGFISPDNVSLFGGYTKTDFLWSIAIRAQ